MSDDRIDFLAIGDTVVDAFIELQDAEVHCDIDSAACKISMTWGDKIPYRDVHVVYAVGNSPNASVSAARLGLSSGIMTHLGTDQDGDDSVAALERDGVLTEYITRDPDHKTNYHYVLSFNAERTILIKHEKFTYDLARQVAGKKLPKWIYFSSVGEHGLPYHHDIVQWVTDNNIKMAFQPGTFQISLGSEKLKDVYAASEVFFCNVEEPQRILNTETRDLPTLLKGIHALGPKIVFITDGPEGAYAYDSHHQEMWFMPIYPDPKPPVERTGAGDAFSSTATAALAAGKSVREAIMWGPINSMNVVQHIGAQAGLLSRDELLKYLENAPDHYVPQKIEF
ncbi:MAG: carbohydrate kinase family protein [Candidatus Pacebacteria bacterium]|nr:carbohydrate kinase family protein [Candidatus Paceibacterota bacterium]